MDHILFQIFKAILFFETMKFLGSTKSKIAKEKNGENMPDLEITEVVLVHWILVTVIINMIHESSINLFLINHLVSV